MAPISAAGLAADDARERLDNVRQDTNTQGDAQGDEVHREQAVHDGGGVGENARKVEAEAQHMLCGLYPFFTSRDTAQLNGWGRTALARLRASIRLWPGRALFIINPGCAV